MARTKNSPPVAPLPELPSDNLAPSATTTINETPTSEATATNDAATIETLAPVVESAEPEPELPLLERMRRAAEESKRDLDAEWTAVVAKLVTNSATEAEVEDILHATGRTIDELQAATDRERELSHLRTLIADYGDAEQALTVAHQAWVEFKKRREAIINELDAESKRLRQAEWMATRRRDRCRDARVKLEKLTGIITNYDRNGTAVPVTASAETVDQSNPVTAVA